MAAVIIAPGDARRYAIYLTARKSPLFLLQTTANAKADGYRLAAHSTSCHPNRSCLRLTTGQRHHSTRTMGVL